jgi:hypothetical protein
VLPGRVGALLGLWQRFELETVDLLRTGSVLRFANSSGNCWVGIERGSIAIDEMLDLMKICTDFVVEDNCISKSKLQFHIDTNLVCQ